jgi:periplasmic divalent cation tolerance protein
MNTEYGMVMTTFSDPETGRRLAEGLLEKRLVACVQTMPIRSTYRWKGSVQKEAETLMLIKTKVSLYPEVEAFIRASHSYEVPEIIRVPIAAGFAGYLQWIDDETK